MGHWEEDDDAEDYDVEYYLRGWCYGKLLQLMLQPYCWMVLSCWVQCVTSVYIYGVSFLLDGTRGRVALLAICPTYLPPQT
eukprot:5688032-Ditylum_brightwellii.AAC.1